jgi:aspartate-semialdehyde dehydrogenase
MKSREGGCRVAVVGSLSLLGKELVAQFEERGFPIARLVTFEDELEEPELPILDFEKGERKAVGAQSVRLADLDFVFVAAPLGRLPAFLATLDQKTPLASGSECTVIDLSGSLQPSDDVPVRIPRLDSIRGAGTKPRAAGAWIAPHGATVAASLLLLRLASRFEMEKVTAHVFSPAGEMGARGIEELQKQTIHLLSFQKIPQEIFGAQMAFNLLPRLAGAAKTAGPNLEPRLRNELKAALGSRAPLPALRAVQAPVFYSLGLSLYVEMRKAVTPAAAEAALRGEPVEIRKSSETAPSPVEAAGTGDILVDAVAADPGHSGGLWLWSVADPLRLAAVNAIEIAEGLLKRPRS